MDRPERITEITPELNEQLRRARAAAVIIIVGFTALFVFFAPENVDQTQVAMKSAIQASR